MYRTFIKQQDMNFYYLQLYYHKRLRPKEKIILPEYVLFVKNYQLESEQLLKILISLEHDGHQVRPTFIISKNLPHYLQHQQIPAIQINKGPQICGLTNITNWLYLRRYPNH